MKVENPAKKDKQTGSSDSGNQPIPGWLNAILIAGSFALFAWLEYRSPLRRNREERVLHGARNLALAGLSAASIQIAERPVTSALSRKTRQGQWGLLPRLPLAGWLKTMLAVTLLDYTLYLWHVLVHKVPFLWRFHQAHHSDLDMDTSTGIRFHFGEFMVSIPFRALQIVLIGVSPQALSIWQTVTLVEVLFHHSNFRFSQRMESWLSLLVVTPRLHGIHHSMIREETNSNWSSGLTVWDKLHGTFRGDVAQETISIGLPAFRSTEQLTLPRVLEMPLRDPEAAWCLPEGGIPVRRFDDDSFSGRDEEGRE